MGNIPKTKENILSIVIKFQLISVFISNCVPIIIIIDKIIENIIEKSFSFFDNDFKFPYIV